jgi:hypothetical protein
MEELVILSIDYPHYVEIPTKCSIRKLNDQISSRKILTGILKNNYIKKIVFILMNPIRAFKFHSDKTINKCARIAFNDLSYFEIGKFSIVNAYPFYESRSSKLNDVLTDVKNTSKGFYFAEIFSNLYKIQQEIINSDYVLMGTGRIPNNVLNQKEYKFILDTIYSYIESYKGIAFLGTSAKKYNNQYVY